MNVDYTCSRCGRDHALPVEQCPFVGYAPRPVTRGPTPEELHAQRLQALQEKHDAENRERQQEADRLERQKTLERAKVQEMMRQVHEQEAADRERRSAELKAAMAEAREWMKRRAQIGRLERKLETRAEAQRAKDEARAKQLTAILAAREQAQTKRRAAQQASGRKKGRR